MTLGTSQAESRDVRLGIVSGRRRQGKTYLLVALVDRVGGFFYTAVDATETEALTRFGQALAEHTGGGHYAFDNWDEALERAFAVVPEGLIVLDEFPYLTKATPSLPSLLQRALDPRGWARRGQARLLLCGSAMSVMGGLLGGARHPCGVGPVSNWSCARSTIATLPGSGGSTIRGWPSWSTPSSVAHPPTGASSSPATNPPRWTSSTTGCCAPC